MGLEPTTSTLRVRRAIHAFMIIVLQQLLVFLPTSRIELIEP